MSAILFRIPVIYSQEVQRPLMTFYDSPPPPYQELPSVSTPWFLPSSSNSDHGEARFSDIGSSSLSCVATLSAAYDYENQYCPPAPKLRIMELEEDCMTSIPTYRAAESSLRTRRGSPSKRRHRKMDDCPKCLAALQTSLRICQDISQKHPDISSEVAAVVSMLQTLQNRISSVQCQSPHGTSVACDANRITRTLLCFNWDVSCTPKTSSWHSTLSSRDVLTLQNLRKKLSSYLNMC